MRDLVDTEAAALPVAAPAGAVAGGLAMLRGRRVVAGGALGRPAAVLVAVPAAVAVPDAVITRDGRNPDLFDRVVAFEEGRIVPVPAGALP
ncbi:MAG: hypothetical protein AAFZ09_05750 [Pseudomonadota bacterium]